MTALMVRNFQPGQYEPANIVVLVTGGVALLRLWNNDADLGRATREALSILRAYLSELLLAAATFTATAILAIVA